MVVDVAPAAEIVVTAPRLPDAAGDAAFAITTIPADRIRIAPTLDEALKRSAGFSLYRRTSTLGANPTTQGASLRAIAGSGASRALVTLDGAPVNDPFGGWVIWTALPSQTIGRARIVRGGGAGPYGAGALTGTVALDSREDLDGVAAGAEVGSLGYRQGVAALGGLVGGARLLADVAGQSSDGWIPVRDGRGAADRPLSLNAWSGALRAERRLGEAAVSARVSAYDEKRGAGQVSAGSDAKGGQAALTAAQPPAGSRAGWRVQGWLSASDLYNASASLAPGRNLSTPANVQYATPALGYGLNGAVRWTGRASVEVGLDFRAATGESWERYSYGAGDFTRRRKAGGQTLVAGLYAEASEGFGPWLATAGARADYWRQSAGERVEQLIATGATTLDNRPASSDGVEPTARLGLRGDLGGGWAWRSAAYAGFRPATLNELHRPFRVGNTITEANPALTPERLIGAETGLDLKRGRFAGAATVFYNRLDDAITNVTVGAGPATFPIAGFVPAGGVLRQRQNAGRIDATGLEADGAATVAEGAILHAALAWTRSVVDGGSAAPQLTGKRPALTPRLTATAGVSLALSPALTADLDARYESTRYDDDLNTLRLRPALTADARLEWAAQPNLVLFLAVDNLTAAHVQTAEAADGVYSYDAPRVIRVGVRLRR